MKESGEKELGQDLWETSAYTLGRYLKPKVFIMWFGFQKALEKYEEAQKA
jgi:hypothetical protein